MKRISWLENQTDTHTQTHTLKTKHMELRERELELKWKQHGPKTLESRKIDGLITNKKMGRMG